MITAEQIESNKKKFLDTNIKYKIFTDDLLDFLGEDFFIAPASTSLDMYGCFPGGLISHCFKAAKYSVKTNEAKITMLSNDEKTRHVVVRFLTACGIQNVIIDGRTISTEEFYINFMK